MKLVASSMMEKLGVDVVNRVDHRSLLVIVDLRFVGIERMRFECRM